METKRIAAGALDVSWLEIGPAAGWPCILLHGWPYDALSGVEAARRLADEGARAILPWLRGFGRTRFLSAETPRSGEQAALGADLLAFMDALALPRATLAGYDWGGRAACVVSALWPERVEALVTGNGYNIQNIARALEPAAPPQEAAYWYQWYLNHERGARGFAADPAGLARLLWRMWSPEWAFTDEEFAASAAAFANPDWTAVTVHSYRHRYGNAPGDPAFAAIEARLAAGPEISVPTVIVDGDADGVAPFTAGDNAARDAAIAGKRRRVILKGAGHNLPQERPVEWAEAVLAARALR